MKVELTSVCSLNGFQLVMCLYGNLSPLFLRVYIYIYIYIERERERDE